MSRQSITQDVPGSARTVGESVQITEAGRMFRSLKLKLRPLAQHAAWRDRAPPSYRASLSDPDPPGRAASLACLVLASVGRRNMKFVEKTPYFAAARAAVGASFQLLTNRLNRIASSFDRPGDRLFTNREADADGFSVVDCRPGGATRQQAHAAIASMFRFERINQESACAGERS